MVKQPLKHLYPLSREEGCFHPLVSSNNMYNDENGIREEKSGPIRRDQFNSDDQEISDEPSWNLDTTSFGINNVMANSIKFLVNPRHFNHGILRLDYFN